MRRLNDSGAALIEYAMVLPAFLGIVLGVMDASRLIWTQVTLDRAVQSAARCAAVNSTTCGANGAIQSFAAGEAWGLSATSANFTVSYPACGVTVSASLPFSFVAPWPGTSLSAVTAQACYPLTLS